MLRDLDLDKQELQGEMQANAKLRDEYSELLRQAIEAIADERTSPPCSATATGFPRPCSSPASAALPPATSAATSAQCVASAPHCSVQRRRWKRRSTLTRSPGPASAPATLPPATSAATSAQCVASPRGSELRRRLFACLQPVFGFIAVLSHRDWARHAVAEKEDADDDAGDDGGSDDDNGDEEEREGRVLRQRLTGGGRCVACAGSGPRSEHLPRDGGGRLRGRSTGPGE